MPPRFRPLALVVAGFLLLTVILRLAARKPRPLDESRSALRNVATWHLVGWKLVEGERLPWEIWGQARPPFLYERLGESVRVATTKREDLRLPVGDSQPPLTVLHAPPSNKNQLIYLQGWGLPERDPVTRLPRAYRVQTTPHSQPSAELTATYNQPIPSELQEPFPLSEPTLDLKKSSGVALEATVKAQDPEGNVFIALEARPAIPKLAGAPLFHARTYSAQYYLLRDSVRKNATTHPPTAVATDELGGQYSELDQGFNTAQTTRATFLIRHEPLRAGQPRPRRLTLKAMVFLEWSPLAQRYLKPAPLESELTPVSLALPAHPNETDLGKRMPSPKPLPLGTMMAPKNLPQIPLSFPYRVAATRTLAEVTKIYSIRPDTPEFERQLERIVAAKRREYTLAPPKTFTLSIEETVNELKNRLRNRPEPPRFADHPLTP